MFEILLLSAALLPLALAPYLARMARRSPGAVRWLEIFVTAVLVLIAGLHLLPEAWRVGGWPTLVVALIGFAVPALLHRGLHQLNRRARSLALALPMIGLVVHAMLDGLALFTPVAGHGDHPATGGWMAFAVILHRLPVAMVVWWLVQPKLGSTIAAALLATIAGGTLAGFIFGHLVLPTWQASSFALLQAAIAGMLLHVIVERHGILESRLRRRSD